METPGARCAVVPGTCPFQEHPGYWYPLALTMRESYPYYLAGLPVFPEDDGLIVWDKFSGAQATRVGLADGAAIAHAITAAEEAAGPMAQLAAYERAAVLEHCVGRFTERSEELAQVLCCEAGKPIADSRGEVTRLIDTFKVAAQECLRPVGEVLTLDISPRARGYRGMTRRVPVGPCSFITPFNFPLNLVAHKVAPAIAAGCPFVLKPASLTPVGALIIGEVLAETDLPSGAFSILPASRAAAGAFTTDERLKLLSFTGSPQVGWDLKARAGKKKVVLELGGNAAVIVDETLDEAGLEDAVQRILIGAFYQSGQSCVGVQRILLHHSIYEELRERLVAGAAAWECGDPRDESKRVGPMISIGEAERVDAWVSAARSAGARLLCGGSRAGVMYPATLLESVPRECDLYAREVFGPVALLSPFHDFPEALAEVNDSAYGLQAGVFTRDLYRAQSAWDTLEVGGVLVGEVPSWRVDHMPYGGVKDSGIGREGVRYAMEDMTEERLLVIRTP